MKKELSPAVLLGALLGLCAVIGLIIFFAMKSDPAAQAPNPTPRFDASAKEADSQRGDPTRGPNAAPPGQAVAPP